MPDKPKDSIPSYEEIECELGLDRMAFMSEMLRPGPPEEQPEEEAIPAHAALPGAYTPEEQDIIELLRQSERRMPTQQEINLALDQARHMGELPPKR
jgi:hypothetical protein